MAWQRIKGDSARRYINTETGEIISRHFYDTRYGLLKKQGFKGYKAKAKASPDAVRKARPAKGRRTTRPLNLKRLNPFVGRQTRALEVMGDVVRTNNLGEFHDDFILAFGPGITAIYDDISKNKKVMAYRLTMTKFTGDSEEMTVTLWPSIMPDEPPQWPFIVSAAGELTYPGDKVTKVSLIVRFHDRFIKAPKKRAKKKQLKIKM